MRVEIWSDIACPWCYVGKARFDKALAAFPHRAEVEVVHRSFELDPGRAQDDIEPVVTMLTRKYGMSEAQALAGEDDLGALAAAEGLDYRTRGRDHGSTFDMHRLLHFAKEQGRQDELLQILYRANFAEERSVYSEGAERLVELAAEAGLDADAVRKVLADPAAYADDVRTDEREAAQLGATGVPFFVLDRTYGISGAQPTEVFAQALTRAWGERAPLQLIKDEDADACGPDGCAVPQGRNSRPRPTYKRSLAMPRRNRQWTGSSRGRRVVAWRPSRTSSVPSSPRRTPSSTPRAAGSSPPVPSTP
ncbi:DsbA family oxidoreductase [Streptomyces deserti]